MVILWWGMVWSVGGECGDTVVGVGVVCGGGNAVILWWGMVWSYPCGLFVWESRLVPTFAVWVLWGLEVHCSGPALSGFLVPFLL